MLFRFVTTPIYSISLFVGFVPFLVGLSGDLWENIPIKEIVYWGDFLEKERKMTDTIKIEAGWNIFEVKADAKNLYIEHHRHNRLGADCDCPPQRIIQATVRGKNFNIFVPTCTAVIGKQPILDACNCLSEHTGYSIIKSDETKEIVNKYTNETIYDFRQEVSPVINGTFGNDYYLKREVLEFCSKSTKPVYPCSLCGVRHCDNYFCRNNSWDFSHNSELYSYRTHGKEVRIHGTDIYVYFIYHIGTRQVKIGHSTNPEKRIQTHLSSNSGEMRVLGIIYGSKFLESSIHQDLKTWLAPGKKEWFFYSETVAKYIQRVLDCVKNYEGKTPKNI